MHFIRGSHFRGPAPGDRPNLQDIGQSRCEPVDSYEFLIDDRHVVSGKAGLKVNAVTAGSPAEKAGVSNDDVLVFYNNFPVNEIGQLVLAIGENKDQPAEISLVRQRKIVKVNLVPSLREQESVAWSHEAPKYKNRLTNSDQAIPHWQWGPGATTNRLDRIQEQLEALQESVNQLRSK